MAVSEGADVPPGCAAVAEVTEDSTSGVYQTNVCVIGQQSVCWENTLMSSSFFYTTCQKKSFYVCYIFFPKFGDWRDSGRRRFFCGFGREETGLYKALCVCVCV